MIFSTLYTELLYRPLFNALVGIYDVVPGRDLGVAIILLTIFVRVLLHPLVAKQHLSQHALMALQPKVQKIRAEVKDQQEQARQLMALYREKGVHPASGCLPVLLQLPILFAIYRVLATGITPESLASLYAWVPHPGMVETTAFGILDLAKASPVLAILAGAFQYVQSRMLLPPKMPKAAGDGPDMAAMMTTQSLYVMPIITVVISFQFPAGLALYWVTTTIVGILQTLFIRWRHDHHFKALAA